MYQVHADVLAFQNIIFPYSQGKANKTFCNRENMILKSTRWNPTDFLGEGSPKIA